ncbi:MbcA/ParS/Xre antitoxin family protein [Paucibacter sp. B2R-40]|uniref:MbcA/ParS/Xre antitoxin family protein n=1 Tax=Paucibacter sp. B2R-40 TaxID=2893554 RepID=UPI0021E3A7AC|nr:MbcA/ParS/Xre antitoxin family protein [Paucibacter sp. B2R-40]MCV2355601.1 MbcA/ParS/Xre antitoxin family protein [Paucibacter sp. B2R-40]
MVAYAASPSLTREAGFGSEQGRFKRSANGGPELQSPEAAAAALRGFFRIAQAWGLSNDEQQRLLGCGRTTFFDWKAGRIKNGLDAATLERLSHLFGIYAGLQILLPVPERADAWIKKPNSAPLFGGSSALARMLGGQVSDLFVVRQYLDAQRGGWA